MLWPLPLQAQSHSSWLTFTITPYPKPRTTEPPASTENTHMLPPAYFCTSHYGRVPLKTPLYVLSILHDYIFILTTTIWSEYYYSPLYSWGNQGTEQINDLLELIQIICCSTVLYWLHLASPLCPSTWWILSFTFFFLTPGGFLFILHYPTQASLSPQHFLCSSRVNHSLHSQQYHCALVTPLLL